MLTTAILVSPHTRPLQEKQVVADERLYRLLPNFKSWVWLRLYPKLQRTEKAHQIYIKFLFTVKISLWKALWKSQNMMNGERPAPTGEPYAPSDSASPAPYGECGTPELYSYNNIHIFNNHQLTGMHSRAVDKVNDQTISEIFENAELENFHKDDDRQLYKIVLEKMYNSKDITVDGTAIPQKAVREQLRKIDYEVMAEAHESTRYKAVANKVGYLISVIYNALLLKVNDDFNLEQGYKKHGY